MKKLISIILVMSFMFSMSFSAFAEQIQSRTVIGADLNDEQRASVYNAFGIDRGEVIELYVTNAEEREYLEGYVDDSVIGTRSISCVET